MRENNALYSAVYRRFLVGSVGYVAGWWLQRTTLAWTVWEMSHSPVSLGVLGLTEVAPMIVLAPVTGLVLDRVARIQVLRACQIAAAAIAVSLVLLSATQLLTVYVAIGIFAARGVVNAMYLPTSLAIVPSLVDRQRWTSAISINSILSNASFTIGPSLAGAILLYTSAEIAYITSACLNLVCLILFYTIPVTKLLPNRDRAGNILVESISGCVYALRHPVTYLMFMALIVATVCVRSIIDLLPSFASATGSGGAGMLSLLLGGIGLGTTVGAIWMAFAGSRGPADLKQYVIGAFAVMAAAIALFALSDDPWVRVGATFIVGVVLAFNGIGTQTVIQQEVEESFRGRVMALYVVIFRGGWGLGALALSGLASALGLRSAVIVSAIACALAWLWLALRRPSSISF